ncbi:MAG: hypothetical protein CM1200mP27_05970 [Chloroflexota bacterium]|nr:MAG: hypothetical protein CM1200mP27_05970 [Chloroflexota bacterium]
MKGPGVDERLDFERLVLAGGPLGIMQSCLDVVIPTFIKENNLVNLSVNSN